MTKESFCERTGLRTVDIISGGFPCQPFSKAGQRRGKSDDRYLWPEMLRVIDELRPTWVIGENVANILNLALDDVLSDLESKGYTARAFMVSARGVGAPHQRYRFAIVAHADGDGRVRAGPAPAEGRIPHQVNAPIAIARYPVISSKTSTPGCTKAKRAKSPINRKIIKGLERVTKNAVIKLWK